eukprot:scaffold660_cov365-Pavlova_lutheri.AAC.16
MEEHGFKMYGVCAEYPDMAAKTKKTWGLSFELLGNPSNSLVKKLKDDKIIELTTTPRRGYENGFVQPGLLFIRNTDGTPKVIFSWVSELDKGNGAWGRPQPAESWDAVKKSLEDQTGPQLQEIPRTTFGSLCNACTQDFLRLDCHRSLSSTIPKKSHAKPDAACLRISTFKLPPCPNEAHVLLKQ